MLHLNQNTDTCTVSQPDNLYPPLWQQKVIFFLVWNNLCTCSFNCLFLRCFFSDSCWLVLVCVCLQTKRVWTAGSPPSATAPSHCMSSSTHTNTHTPVGGPPPKTAALHPHRAAGPSCSSPSTFPSPVFIICQFLSGCIATWLMRKLPTKDDEQIQKLKAETGHKLDAVFFLTL